VSNWISGLNERLPLPGLQRKLGALNSLKNRRRRVWEGILVLFTRRATEAKIRREKKLQNGEPNQNDSFGGKERNVSQEAGSCLHLLSRRGGSPAWLSLRRDDRFFSEEQQSKADISIGGSTVVWRKKSRTWLQNVEPSCW
jgi:hypothetical protein